MGQISDFRMRKPYSQKPFIYVGIDYFGPYEIEIFRKKRYSIIFMFFSMRNTH